MIEVLPVDAALATPTLITLVVLLESGTATIVAVTLETLLLEACETVNELEPVDVVALEGTLTTLLVVIEILTPLSVADTGLTLLTSKETCATEVDELESKDVVAFDAAGPTLPLAILESCAPALDLELIVVTLPSPLTLVV